MGVEPLGNRSEKFQHSIDTAFIAFDGFARDAKSREAVAKIFSAMKDPAAGRQETGTRLPVCSLLKDALPSETDNVLVSQFVDTFWTIEPSLEWRRRSDPNGLAWPAPLRKSTGQVRVPAVMVAEIG